MEVDSLLGELWRDVIEDKLLRVFAIQDAAADSRIYPNLVLAMTENACLYEGKIPSVLLEAAPHLVRLAALSPYTRWYVSQGWGRNWGIFAQSKARLAELRRHFQGLMQVRSESGRALTFRFFDPRVLRVYLPTCTAKELAAVFGPVERFFVESAEPGELLRFGLDDGRLVQTRIALAGRAPAFTAPQAAPPDAAPSQPVAQRIAIPEAGT